MENVITEFIIKMRCSSTFISIYALNNQIPHPLCVLPQEFKLVAYFGPKSEKDVTSAYAEQKYRILNKKIKKSLYSKR